MAEIIITEFTEQDLDQMTAIWNEIVAAGNAFPQTDHLTRETAFAFFSQQTYTGVAKNAATGEVIGLYILHPNNIGRCGHIANSSYAVKSTARGLKAGEQLVTHSLEKAKMLGFRILQFNAVVKTNYSAIHLYEKLGFVQLGTIPGGFRMDDGYEDIIIFYRTL